jgi:hypothetical protein
VGKKLLDEGAMAKYEPLRIYLESERRLTWRATFSEIENILKTSLPRSAHQYAPWWANDQTHVQAQAWMQAGWYTESCDLQGKSILFTRKL